MLDNNIINIGLVSRTFKTMNYKRPLLIKNVKMWEEHIWNIIIVCLLDDVSLARIAKNIFPSRLSSSSFLFLINIPSASC